MDQSLTLVSAQVHFLVRGRRSKDAKLSLIHIPLPLYNTFLQPILALLLPPPSSELQPDENADFDTVRSRRPWAYEHPFVNVSVTPLECSIVCSTSVVKELFVPIRDSMDPKSKEQIAISNDEYVCIQVDGEGLDAGQRVLELSSPLAMNGISIFFITTYFSDYILVPLKSRAAVTSALEARGFAFSTSSEAFVNIASPLMQPQLGYAHHRGSSSTSSENHQHPSYFTSLTSPIQERPPSTPPPSSIAELQTRTFALLKRGNIAPTVDPSLRLVQCAGRKDTLRGGTGSHSSFTTSHLRLQLGLVKCLVANPRPRFLSLTLTDAEPASLLLEPELLANFQSGAGDGESDVLLGNVADVLVPITLDLRDLPMESTGIVCGIAGRLVGGTSGGSFDSDAEDGTLDGSGPGPVEMSYLSTARSGTVMVAEVELERALGALRGVEDATSAAGDGIKGNGVNVETVTEAVEIVRLVDKGAGRDCGKAQMILEYDGGECSNRFINAHVYCFPPRPKCAIAKHHHSYTASCHIFRPHQLFIPLLPPYPAKPIPLGTDVRLARLVPAPPGQLVPRARRRIDARASLCARASVPVLPARLQPLVLLVEGALVLCAALGVEGGALGAVGVDGALGEVVGAAAADYQEGPAVMDYTVVMGKYGIIDGADSDGSSEVKYKFFESFIGSLAEVGYGSKFWPWISRDSVTLAEVPSTVSCLGEIHYAAPFTGSELRQEPASPLPRTISRFFAHSSVTSARMASGSDSEYSARDVADDDFDLGQGGPPKKKARVAASAFSKSRALTAGARKARNANDEDELPFLDVSTMKLKPDHADRPIWIDPANHKIILESFSPLVKQAQVFLVAIAEPVSRPTFLHEYKYTEQSLLSAQAIGLQAPDIIKTLETFSKSALPEELKQWILETTKTFGKIKLLLKDNKYYIQSPDRDALQMLLNDSVIGKLRIQGTDLSSKEKAPSMAGLVIPGTKESGLDAKLQRAQAEDPTGQARRAEDDDDGVTDEDMMALMRAEDEDDDDEDLEQMHSFQIEQESVEKVKARCLEIKLPITEEYDFRADTINANLSIDLKPAARIRDYQEMALSKMFGNGRARSGIIVLPCGAGKTLVGITAACTVQKGVVILCTSAMSVEQWKNELLKWTNIDRDDIAVFTADSKGKFKNSTGVIISTYSMISERTKRSHDTQKMLEFLKGREWGLTLLDEVHVVPANMFRKVSEGIRTHSKLGLTATLLREDDKISDLNYLIGPKLYEANWMELAEQGHIARVQCAEVWCPMTSEFYTEYLRATAKKRLLYYTMNPRKFQACQFLIDYHEKRGDKIIVFSDNVYTLKRYARALDKFFIHGGTTQGERMTVLENFQHNPEVNTIFLSKVGDTSLDLPEATCLIQISSHYGSRRQEAQRLGRILRAKRRNDEGFNAFFYSLVSKDTDEMYFSSKRQAFLVDQGYAFKVITHLQGIESLPGLHFNTPQSRRELLQDVMLQAEMSNEIEHIDEDIFASSGRRAGPSGGKAASRPAARRTAGMLGELSGGQDMAYIEYNKGKNKDLKGKAQSNPFIKKLRRENEKRKAANAELSKPDADFDRPKRSW
ncbi:hypothetical protein FH972_024612 [Carpinus fangiana]|uniref:DNA 3'-5' helicase n=1 Tax=Carpinus fangiana TaxID=176857 RepID=A0A5N6KYH7_9ROSI|nr:hypothetical protein FH972_024612 [Carpinus fangiana]